MGRESDYEYRNKEQRHLVCRHFRGDTFLPLSLPFKESERTCGSWAPSTLSPRGTGPVLGILQGKPIVSQMRKLRFWREERLAQGHTIKWGWGPNTRSFDFWPIVIRTYTLGEVLGEAWGTGCCLVGSAWCVVTSSSGCCQSQTDMRIRTRQNFLTTYFNLFFIY